MDNEEQANLLDAIELLRQAAHAAYDERIAGVTELHICGIPRYLLFMKIHRAMIHLQNRVWGF